MRAAIAIAPLALLASSCGGKVDPVAKTLAQSSEHVTLRGTVTSNGTTQAFTAAGAFTNHPDQGMMTMHFGPQTVHEVINGSRVYIRSTALKLTKGKSWLLVNATRDTVGTQTPTHMLRHGYPMSVKDGLVRHIEIKTKTLTISVDFSRFGEPVHVHVPSAATTTREGT
ncbi:MAG: hypothetical protein QOH16_899 [Gaiellaceae bacterium]|nr:hypothetical protein [Gaiellaceae bacterium]